MTSRTSITTPVHVDTDLRKIPSAPKSKHPGVTYREKPVYRCLQCGKEYDSLAEGFFKSPHTKLYQEYKGYIPICKQCMLRLLNELNAECPERTLALQIVCAVMDLPFFRSTAQRLADEPPSKCIPSYIKTVQGLSNRKTPRAMTFIDTLMKERVELGASNVGQTRQEMEEKWDSKSKDNKAYVQDIVGYDPFNDEAFSANDRQYLFNTMAGYCPDNSIGGDSHKLQSIINIVIAQQQVHAVDELINKELAKEPENIDSGLLAKYSSMKRDMLAAIDKMADNNEISAKTTKAGKGANSLSDRIRRIEKSGFDDIKMNRFAVKTAEAFQQIADISTHAIIAELAFQDNDYSSIISEQNVTINDLTKKSEALEEENRLLNNELVRLKEQIGETEEDDDL